MRKFLILGIIFVVFLNFLVSAQDFKVIGNPESEVVSFFVNESYEFSISNKFDNSKWYLDGKLVVENESLFEFKDYKSGIYVLRVDVFEGELGDSKTWNVVVKEGRLTEKVNTNWKEILFYSFLSILIIIIFLVVRLIIVENKRIGKVTIVSKGKNH